MKVPASLRTEFVRRFPGHRQILVSDYDPSTIKGERQYHKGDPCIAADTEIEAIAIHIDDSGEDYLYPSRLFLPLHVSPALREALRPRVTAPV